MRPVAAILVTVLLLLAGIAFWDSSADIPVLSPVVCAVKGGAWYGGGILGPAGCYRAGGP